MMLEVRDLEARFDVEEGQLHAVDGVSFDLEQGQILGLIGESGSGKTTMAKSIMRLLPENGRIVGGEIRYKGENLLEYGDNEFRKDIRWKEIAMIPQNAMDGFDPVYTVGEQIVEAIRVHEPETSKKSARKRARELFEDMGLDTSRIDDYPHQFSGGMAQRAMIALALSCDPDLLIADEPTTGLDVVIQNKILNTIKDALEAYDSSMILITHDISVVANTCNRVAIVYGGRVVEQADLSTILNEPLHPYTLGLRNAFPEITKDDQELISIPGSPPDLTNPEEGCRFAPRCPFAIDECWPITPESEDFGPNHSVECHRAGEMDDLRTDAEDKDTWLEPDTATDDSSDPFQSSIVDNEKEQRY